MYDEKSGVGSEFSMLTKQMVADYYEVDERTIERFLEANKEELEHNGYFLCKGNSLKKFKLRFASDIDVATKTTVLGLFEKVGSFWIFYFCDIISNGMKKPGFITSI